MKRNGNHAPRQRQIATTTRLSCEACTKRKVKCDKTIPCTNCQNSGILCVPVERKRLPRGRSRRLENWPAQVPWDLGYYDSNDMTAEASPSPDNPSPSQSLSQPIFNELSVPRGLDSRFPQYPHRWDTTTYNYCNTAPRYINSHCNITDLDHLAQSCISPSRPINGFLQTSEPTDIALDGNPLFEKTYFDGNGYREQRHLTKIYLTQVEPILNILQPNRPSVEAYLLSGNSYLDYDLEHPAPTALASAIYYVASCALSAEKCVSEFGMSKEDLVSKYQKKSNFALESADYMITEDITVLQAFIISLVAMRCHDHTRRFWTMLALALRIAQALSLHEPNPPFPASSFEREMRHRLWHIIGWLDVQASLSRASEPMIQSSWLNFQPFLDRDNEEVSTILEMQVLPRTRISEPSLSHIFALAQETARYLTVSSSITPYTNDVHRRQLLVFAFKQYTIDQFFRLLPDQVDFHWYLKELSQSIGVFLQLLAIYPPEKKAYVGFPRARNGRALQVAVQALETRFRVYENPKTQPWRWIQPLFFPWQALKIALTEVQACQNLRLVKSAWPLIEQGYKSFIALGIGSTSLELLESIQGMMRRAREFYDSAVPFSLLNGSRSSTLPFNASLQVMCCHQATCECFDGLLSDKMSCQESGSSRWTEEPEPDGVDTLSTPSGSVSRYGPTSLFGNTAEISNPDEILKVMEVIDQELLF